MIHPILNFLKLRFLIEHDCELTFFENEVMSLYFIKTLTRVKLIYAVPFLF